MVLGGLSHWLASLQEMDAELSWHDECTAVAVERAAWLLVRVLHPCLPPPRMALFVKQQPSLPLRACCREAPTSHTHAT